MPTYEYECTKCGDRFERFQTITEEPLRHCPTCRGRVRRLIGTGAGIIFKGSGFYATDYRSPSYQSSAQKEKGEGFKSEPERSRKAQKGSRAEKQAEQSN
ncbi:MAG: FmdB family zinc ribbon protein [Kiritimatiellia bacterium]